MPTNKPEVKDLISNEPLMSDYSKFAQTVLSMPSMEGFDVDFDVGVERIDDSPSDDPQERFVLYTDSAL